MAILGYHQDSGLVIMDQPAQPLGEELDCLEDSQGPIVLDELGTYFLKCQGQLPSYLENSPYITRRFPQNLFEITFRNCVGLTRIGPMPVKIRNRKITEVQYCNMLDSITSKSANLIFSFSQPVGLNARRIKPGKDVVYLEMLFIKMYLLDQRPDIDGIASAILADPHRIFERSRHCRRLEDVSDLDHNACLEMVSRAGGLNMLPVNHTLGSTALATALLKSSGRNLYPSELVVEEKHQSLDSHENRFVKHMLGWLIRKISEFNDVCRSGGSLNQNLTADMALLEKKLRRFAMAAMWRDVGQMRMFPASSQVLQRREGYRSFFHLYSLLTLCTQVDFTLPDFSRIIETKDVPTLYEYWAFFVVKELLEENTGLISSRMIFNENLKEQTLQYELRLEYEQGVKLCFNRTFTAPGKSYSHDLRPDISIEYKGKVLIFDAKYKGKNAGFYGEEDQQGVIRTFQTGDIDKMHTYRDAIDNVEGAFALYPGQDRQLFQPPEARKIYQGVGALSLRPGPQNKPEPEHEKDLREIIQAFLRSETNRDTF